MHARPSASLGRRSKSFAVHCASALAVLAISAWAVVPRHGAHAAGPAADLVVVNGAVYPGGGVPWAEALAIAGGKILKVGTNEEIQALKSPGTKTVDAHGGTVMAGFNDSHVHFLGGGQSLEQVNLFEAGDLASVQAR